MGKKRKPRHLNVMQQILVDKLVDNFTKVFVFKVCEGLELQQENLPHWKTCYQSVINEFEECITENSHKLVRLDYLDPILDYLVSAEVAYGENKPISTSQLDDIRLSTSGKEKKVRKLISLLKDRGETALKHFLAAIVKTHQEVLLDSDVFHNCRDKVDDIVAQMPNIHPLDVYGDQLKQYSLECITDYSEARPIIGAIPFDKHQPRVVESGRQSRNLQVRRDYRRMDEDIVKGEEIDMKNPFMSPDGPVRIVLLMGDPGMGKTAFCYSILQMYIKAEWNKADKFIFLIQLRRISQNKRTKMTIKELLLSYHGPSSEAWNELLKREEEILILLDGYDEVEDFMKSKVTLCDPKAKATPFVLLRNLVCGKLLPRARVLITSRPVSHLLLYLRKEEPHEVLLKELELFQIQKLVREVVKEQPLADAVNKYLENESDIASLCATPVNIQGLLGYIQWKKKKMGGDDNALIIHSLPRRKSELQWKMVLSHLLSTNRNLSQDACEDENIVWNECSSLLQRIAKLAAHGLLNDEEKIQTIFPESTLRDFKIEKEEVAKCGLLVTLKKRAVGFLSDTVTMTQFGHLTQQECCASLEVANGDKTSFFDMIEKNNGQLDVILLNAVSLLSNPTCREVLQNIYPDINEDSCETKAQEVMHKMIKSKKDDIHWRIFMMSVLHESQMKDIDAYTEDIQTSPGMLRITEPGENDLHTLAQYLSHLKQPYNSVHLIHPIPAGLHHLTNSVCGAKQGFRVLKVEYGEWTQCIPGLGAVEWPSCMDERSNIYVNVKNEKKLVDVREIVKGLTPGLGDGSPSLTHLHLVSCNLEGEEIGTLIANKPQLLSLYLSQNNIGAKDGKDSCLDLLSKSCPKLIHLQLAVCELRAVDIEALCHNEQLAKHLKLLDITGNPEVGNEGASHVAKLLAVEKCALETLLMADCGVQDKGICQILQTNNTSLKVLNVSTVDTEDVKLPDNMNLTGLDELYVRHVDVSHLLSSLKSMRVLDLTGCVEGLETDHLKQTFQQNASLQALTCDYHMLSKLEKVGFPSSLKSLRVEFDDEPSVELLLNILGLKQHELNELWLKEVPSLKDDVWEKIASELLSKAGIQLKKIGIWPKVPHKFVELVGQNESFSGLEMFCHGEDQNNSGFTDCPNWQIMPSEYSLKTVDPSEKGTLLECQSCLG